MGSEIRPFRRQRGDIGVIRSDTTIFVSPTGNDNNSGLTETKPFRTIAKAFTFLKNYHILEDATVTISLTAGKYRISSELVMDHPQGNRILLKGYNTPVKNVTKINSYLDTTSYAGKVGGKSYIKIQKSIDGGAANTSGDRFDMIPLFSSGSGIPQTTAAIGNYVVISPLDSLYEIQLNHNSSSILNGVRASNTSPQRYSETESTMRRLFGVGGHSIKTNAADFGSNPVLENRTRNVNVYDSISNTVTSRVHTFSSPAGVNLYSSGNTSVSTRYISTVIQVVGDITALRITESALRIKDIAFESRDPLTSPAGKSTKPGIVVDDNSVLTLDQGFVVKNFETGVHVKNKSLLTQYNMTANPYISFTYCGTGLLVSDGSTAVLNGAIATGCWDTGFYVNSQSIGEFNSCISIGNGSDGFLASRNSNIVCVRSVAAYNLQNVARNFSDITEGGIGFGSRLNSNLECVGCLSFRNGYGYFSDKNSALNATSCDSVDNVNRGISVTESSSASVGPYFYSLADASGQVVTDCSFAKTTYSQFDYSGFDTPSGVSGPSISVAAVSNLSMYDVDINYYATNGIEALYGSVVSSDLLNIKENSYTQGESVNATYQSTVRLSGASLGTRETSKYSLLNGYIELNGVELDGN